MQIFLDTEQWGRLEITERVEGWDYVTRDGVGWETASLNLGGSIIEQWPLLEHQSEDLVEFYDGTMLCWRGVLSGAELNEANALVLNAEGAGLRMRDVGTWRVFSDASYAYWHAVDDPPEGFTADNNNRVCVEGKGDFDDSDEHLIAYPETGLELGAAIARLVARVELSIVDGAWIAEIRQGEGTVLWTSSTSTQQTYTLFLAAPTGGTFKLGNGDGIETAALDYDDSAGDIEAALRAAYSDATITVTAGDDFVIVFPTGGAGEFQITDDALTYADSGAATCSAEDIGVDVDLAVDDTSLVVALRKDGTTAGEATFRLTQVVVQTLAEATNSSVIAEILADAGIGYDVEESGLAINRALWQEQSRLQAIQEMARLGDGTSAWRFVSYERATFDAWPDDVTWELRREDLSRWSITWRRDAVRNAVRARLPGGWLSAWFVDTDSIERWGRREYVLAAPDTLQAEAELLAQIYLTEHASALAGLRLTVDAYCRAPDGARYPIWNVRAGDILRLRDLIPDQDIEIRVAETKCSASGMDIVPAGADDRLETLLAAQEQAVRGQS